MDAFTFLATLDSKGRLTVPAEIRSKYGLEKGEVFEVSVGSVEVDSIKVDGSEEAREVLTELEDVRFFAYRDGVLEVVRDV